MIVNLSFLRKAAQGIIFDYDSWCFYVVKVFIFGAVCGVCSLLVKWFYGTTQNERNTIDKQLIHAHFYSSDIKGKTPCDDSLSFQ